MSGGNVENLVAMANQIGDFFETMKNRERSLEEITAHLKRFWEPRMRRALMAHVDAHGGEGLKAIVLEALKAHREMMA
jgi:formate dehydrogenase subunit delta